MASPIVIPVPASIPVTSPEAASAQAGTPDAKLNTCPSVPLASFASAVPLDA